MPKVLIAEDNAVTAEMIATRLSNAGYEVLRTSDGQEALECIANENPDLILLDVMMPKLDGFQVLQELKRDPLLGAIPVVMLSARAQEQDILSALAMGATDYVTKPFRFRELLARMSRILAAGPGPLRASVQPGSGKIFIGEIVHGDKENASLRFYQDGAPLFAIGDPATLFINSPALPQAIEIKARIVSRTESESHRTFCLRFHTAHHNQSEMVAGLMRLLRRRSAYRLQFGPDEMIEAQVIAERSGEVRELLATLQDISATGACVLLKPDADRFLCAVDSFTIRFSLPPSDALIALPVSIRHRRACAEGISYGVFFDTGGRPELLELQDEVANFIFASQHSIE